MSSVTVAVVDDADVMAGQKLLAVVDRAGLWDVLADRQRAVARQLRIVIKPDLGAFTSRSPTATDPALVEALIDALWDHGHSEVVVASAIEASGMWAENRDVYALVELLGYRFVTARGRAYEIADLSTHVDDSVFPITSALHGTGLSSVWANADIRIVFAKNKTDELAGYALCLDSLLGAVPLADKHLHYNTARDAGEVVADLLEAAPVHFAIIDALTSAHGAGGYRAPAAIETATLIASPAVLLADQIAAMKMGVDPFASPLFATVMARHPLPPRYAINGSLALFPGWRNVPAPLMRSNRYRAETAAIERAVKPWLQHLDKELFALKNPIDAHINAVLADFFQDVDSSPARQWILILVNLLLGFVGHIMECYNVLFDKDALRQKAVGLGIEPHSYGKEQFNAIVDELLQLEALVAEAPEVAPCLRWRYLDGAVLFSYTRRLPVDFRTFVDRVDVARTIQYMNDYLGGVLVALAHDEAGRPVWQAERNLYLPQPNYMVLYHGKPIDVTKLEVVEYLPQRHRLYWKTIRSENGSATFDDGIATFAQHSSGTMITIMGRQLFDLPPFWKMVDLDLVPDLKAALVTDAYRIFFDRTVANFEALIEGRDIRLGRWADAPDTAVVEMLRRLIAQVTGTIEPLIHRINTAGASALTPLPCATDVDGFIHVIPSPAGATTQPKPPNWTLQIGHFIQGLVDAIERDIRHRTCA